MDVYITDKSFMDKLVINEYVSFIWAERYDDLGDFELQIPSSNVELLSNIEIGDYVRIAPSIRRMVVETIEIDESESDGAVATVTGRSLESLLIGRAVMPLNGKRNSHIYDYTEPYTGTAFGLARAYFEMGIGSTKPAQQASDDLNMTYLPYNYAESISGPQIEVDWQFGNAWDLTQGALRMDNLGFYIERRREGTNPAVPYEYGLYKGMDRSLDQTGNMPIVFSSDTETFNSDRYRTSSTTEKNVAYVYSQTPLVNDDPIQSTFILIVVSEKPEDLLLEGAQRKVLGVSAQEIYDNRGYSYNAYRDLGLKALRENNRTALYEGSVPADNPYLYHVDYRLGDIVSVKGRSGGGWTKMRVVEYIWSSDSNGEVSYPTFAAVDPE